MSAGFTIAQIPSLVGKTFVVTGANTGIGLITAKELARKGGDVILCCRSEAKATEAIQKIQSEFKQANVESAGKLEFIQLDLQSLKSAEAAARAIRQKKQRIDVLINNAGIMAVPFALTKDGIESQFGTNHMGHFVFTTLLLPLIPRDGSGRIINLSSIAHKSPYSVGLLNLDQLFVPTHRLRVPNRKPKRSTLPANRTAIQTVQFALYQGARGQTAPIQSYAVHPGVVNTELDRNLPAGLGPIIGGIAKFMYPYVSISPENGSRTSLAAATFPELGVPNGTYFVPQGKPETPTRFARDPALADKLWSISMEITKKVLGDEVAAEIEKNVSA
ncbi:hypothetical protein BCR44DRAFT_1498828 [Catenaria anguillulae PL171]|uniref:NAD(P)-binding protein n=1 Tax=Catenaria anguillulae PL171 TaxID=765915 RepID=A0A1Y2HRH0_9FUNG|nr:hypothetical protein BCR44DRAFT_1498828 [Catenaria anguillulae PL171]